MEKELRYDYFYGNESEQFSFFRIPRHLVTGMEFTQLSTDAKLLYGLLLDRMGLSARNGWYDEKGRVYIFRKVRQVKRTGHTAAVCGGGRASTGFVKHNSHLLGTTP